MAGRTQIEGVIHEDHLMRQVRQLAQALARIAGLRRAALLDDALQEADRALATLGCIDPRLVAATDVATLVALIQDPARLEVVGRILLASADLEEARGAPARGEALREKGEALCAEAARRRP